MAIDHTFDLARLGYPAEVHIDVVGGSVSGGASEVGDVSYAKVYQYGGLVHVQYTRFNLHSRAQFLYWNQMAARLNGGARSVIVTLDTSPLQIQDTVAVVVGGHSVKASSVTFRTTAGLTLVGGEWFSTDDVIFGWRAYGIAEITEVTDEGGGSVLYTATIAPHLRHHLADGTALDFVTPRCLMHLQQGESMVSTNIPFQIVRPSVSFIEDEW